MTATFLATEGIHASPEQQAEECGVAPAASHANRFALLVEYNGAGFCGWQRQTPVAAQPLQDDSRMPKSKQPPGLNGGNSSAVAMAVSADARRPQVAVQEVLEQALSAVAGTSLQVVAAGRTDAGVHATAQAVHFDTQVTRPLSAWVRGVNAHLPPTVVVRWAQPVPAAFHARFSATARHYTYWLLNRSERPGLWADRVGWYHRPLNAEAMAAAAQRLVGTHDFSSFRASQCQAHSPVRTLSALTVARYGEHIRFTCSGNAFLHHMVRNIVGALLWVGSGKQTADWLTALLAARDRTQAAPTFSAEGLYLTGVDYEASWGLPLTQQPAGLPGTDNNA